MLLVCAVLAVPASGTSYVELVPGDPDSVRAVLETTGVDREPASPALGEYLSDLTSALLDRVSRWLVPELDLSGVLIVVGRVLGVALMVAAALALLLLALRLARSRRSRAAVAPTLTSLEDSGPVDLDPSQWWREMESALEQGRVRRAAEALWWWCAVRLAPGRVDGSWTTGELARSTGRGDLGGPLAVLDVMLYGPRSPRPEDVRDAARALETAL